MEHIHPQKHNGRIQHTCKKSGRYKGRRLPHQHIPMHLPAFKNPDLIGKKSKGYCSSPGQYITGHIPDSNKGIKQSVYQDINRCGAYTKENIQNGHFILLIKLGNHYLSSEYLIVVLFFPWGKISLLYPFCGLPHKEHLRGHNNQLPVHPQAVIANIG